MLAPGESPGLIDMVTPLSPIPEVVLPLLNNVQTMTTPPIPYGVNNPEFEPVRRTRSRSSSDL